MRTLVGSGAILAVAAACGSFGATSEGGVDGGAGPVGDASSDAGASPPTVLTASFEDAFPFGFTEASKGFVVALGEGIDDGRGLELRGGDETDEPQFLKWRSGRVAPSAWKAKFQLRVDATPSEGADANLLRVECGGTSNVDLKLKTNRRLQLQFHGGEGRVADDQLPEEEWVGIELAWSAASSTVTLVRSADERLDLPAPVTCDGAQLAVYFGFVSWNSSPENEYTVSLDALTVEVF